MLTEKEKKELKQKIQSNKHEVYVVSFEEMDAIIKSSPKGQKATVQAAWSKVNGKVGVGANYYYHAKDAVTMAKLIGDLGGVGTRVYIKSYGGKPHIILKGHAGLRTILTGTKYGIKNPKVISMGLGKAGAIGAAKQGGVLTVVVLSVYRVADYFLTDQTTLSQLLGTLATDIVKVGIATGVAISAATAVSAAFTVAIGPIVAVVVFGAFTTMLLDALDKRYGITDKVIDGLDELGDDVNSYIKRAKENLEKSAANTFSEVLDYAVESATRIVINTAKHTLQKFLSPRPRTFR